MVINKLSTGQENVNKPVQTAIYLGFCEFHCEQTFGAVEKGVDK